MLDTARPGAPRVEKAMAMTALTRALMFLEEFRKLDAELPAQYAAALVIIAQNEGITQQDCAARLGASKSAIQRIFDRLGDRGALNIPGYELIEVRTGALDARRRQAFLTPKGRRFIQTLTHLIGE